MSKANEPAYPEIRSNDDTGTYSTGGTTKREKLAMEIYARAVDVNVGGTGEDVLDSMAKDALRAADIFFDELNK